MSDRLGLFVQAANSTLFGSRDVFIDKHNKIKLGNFIFSASTKSNTDTMKAFRESLSAKYGIFGEHSFDSTLSSRFQRKKSLRACDIKRTISNIESIKKQRFQGELFRQLDSTPEYRELNTEVRRKIRDDLERNCFKGIDLSQIKSEADVYKYAENRINKAILNADVNAVDFDNNHEVELNPDLVKDNEATGLKSMSVQMGNIQTSVEDIVKKGSLGSGMRINDSKSNPMLFEKLKTNGVEPGFIYKTDWSPKDSDSMMQDYMSQKSLDTLARLKEEDPALKAKCDSCENIRDQILHCGYLHPAVMSAVADLIIENGMSDTNSEIYKTFKEKFPTFNPNDYSYLDKDVLKKELFVAIRNTALHVNERNAMYGKSPVFKRFSERNIIKLDYNENDRIITLGKKSHGGRFMRPERVLTRSFGTVFRLATTQTSNQISVGAVTEAFANDIGRIMGVPSQDLRIVNAKYSDGHPKLMLKAKFANGYSDFENGFLKDGRLVKPDGYKFEVEKIGRYKAFFLVTADRDAIGSHGQNKGFVNGKFFAIDPGHSLEGNGRYLDIKDNLDFKDTYGVSLGSRFRNYSVFDDDTRFEKIKGALEIRRFKKSGDIEKLYESYRKTFNPDEQNISRAERTLRTSILEEIEKKYTELQENINRVLNAVDSQLKLYDDLANEGAQMQENAIETIENLEKLTSPTTWVSKNAAVPLEHLQVVPDTRIPWSAQVEGNNIVYKSQKPLSDQAKLFLNKFVAKCNLNVEYAENGIAKITVSKANAQAFFDNFSEKNIQKETHKKEAEMRELGGDGLLEAVVYKSPLLK